MLHRDADLPAVIIREDTKKWYKNGLLHRDGDLPAVDSQWYQEWYREGKLHRENDQPAYVCTVKVKRAGRTQKRMNIITKKWYTNGKLHRRGKAAILSEDGDKQWWEDGKRINKTE